MQKRRWRRGRRERNMNQKTGGAVMSISPRALETHVSWRAADVADPDQWTLLLSETDKAEIDAAIASVRGAGLDILDVGRAEFPLAGLVPKLAEVERELIDGRGFARIAGLDAAKYSDDDLTLIYWGLGAHLGEPWPQNKHGHLLGEVTDQGKKADDPYSRGNEIGGIAFDYHTDGSDLVGLMCLRPAARGGMSCVANVVAIYNELVKTRPDLVEVLYEKLPWDHRGEQPPGGKPYYMQPVFTEFDDRLFVKFIPQYIKSSQKYPETPRLTELQREAIDKVSEMARDPDFNVYMDLQPGVMQFINNYHVLHGRSAYEDDAASGKKRHLKRLWLATHRLNSRPPHFHYKTRAHWGQTRSMSHVPAVERV
jgi:hypothetical protein